MKKFLSLVLALVMTMSLVTISAGAKDFTDDSKINYDEAIDVMSELGIIDGYADGSFNPQGSLTRGAAAKIICNLILGTTTAKALSADTAPYKDVPVNHDFAGYIAYCQQKGIISGYADGTFRPGATLTNYAFLKMLLGALGYDAQIEGYVGDNWSVAVAKRAIGIGLTADMKTDLVGTEAATREQACLYALNTLQADLVEYGNKTTVSVNGAVVSVGGNDAQPQKWESSATRVNNIKSDSIVQFAEQYFNKLKLVDGATDDFGRPANTWKYKGDEIGTYAKTPDITYSDEVKGKAIYKDLDKKVANGDIVYYVDGLVTSTAVALNSSNDKKVGHLGSQTDVFYDDDAAYYGGTELTIATVNYYLAQVLGDYDEKNEEVELSAVDSLLSTMSVADWTVESEDVDGLEGLKDEDYVLVTVAWNGTDYDIKSVELAEKVTAAVTEYTVPEDGKAAKGSVTAGGTEYKYNYTYTENDEDMKYELKDEYDLYLDKFGNVILADGVEAAGNYFFVAEYVRQSGLKKGTVVADVYTLDGLNETVTLNKIDGTSVSSIAGIPVSNNPVNKWYSFREKTTGKYDITKQTTAAITCISGQKVVENGKGGLALVGGTSARATNATIFVINDGNDNVKAYTGIKNVPTVTSGSNTEAYAMVSGNYAKFVFINVEDGHIKGGNTSDVIYILKGYEDKYSQDVDDDTYYTYKAIVNGEEKKIKATSDAVVKIAGTPGLYTDISYNDKGYVDDMTLLTARNTAVGQEYEDDFQVETVNETMVRKGDVLTTTSNSVSFYLASGAKAVIIEGGSDQGDIDRFTTASSLASTYKNNALNADITAVLNSDGEATMLYVQLH